MQSLKSWQVSSLLHIVAVAFFAGVTLLRIAPEQVYEVPIEISGPADIQNIAEIKEEPKVVLKSVNEAVPGNKPVREIFGASRDSYTDESIGADVGVVAKKGNTLAKAVDDTVLLDSDAGALPTPTEEYLVSEMPLVISEVRPNYPQEAREKRIEGAVALDVLIDQFGAVRKVSIIDGPEIFRSGAIDAMKRFKFKPALVDGKPVAVRIRYVLNFKLEY